MRVLLCVLALVVGCGGLSYTPEDCKADIAIAELLAERIADLIDGGVVTDSPEWQRYAPLVALLAGRGCEYIPPDWAKDALGE